MAILQPIGNSLTRFHNDRSYWMAKLSTDRWIKETDVSFDLRRGFRERDWGLDIVGSGDALRIKEVWLICPPNHMSPQGNTARLPITLPGTAFQFKVKSLEMGASVIEAQVIGRVDDLDTGMCTAFIWDHRMQCMSLPYKTFVKPPKGFEAWRPGVLPVGALNLEVLGIDLR